ncbi:MAG: tetratricopeptide repeat protein [Elusimicrobiota bacterium]|nr:MAG: tetratricopeptide repeat protein [Elusimicrobiota bacterium]
MVALNIMSSPTYDKSPLARLKLMLEQLAIAPKAADLEDILKGRTLPALGDSRSTADWIWEAARTTSTRLSVSTSLANLSNELIGAIQAETLNRSSDYVLSLLQLTEYIPESRVAFKNLLALESRIGKGIPDRIRHQLTRSIIFNQIDRSQEKRWMEILTSADSALTKRDLESAYLGVIWLPPLPGESFQAPIDLLPTALGLFAKQMIERGANPVILNHAIDLPLHYYPATTAEWTNIFASAYPQWPGALRDIAKVRFEDLEGTARIKAALKGKDLNALIVGTAFSLIGKESEALKNWLNASGIETILARRISNNETNLVHADLIQLDDSAWKAAPIEAGTPAIKFAISLTEKLITNLGIPKKSPEPLVAEVEPRPTPARKSRQLLSDWKGLSNKLKEAIKDARKRFYFQQPVEGLNLAREIAELQRAASTPKVHIAKTLCNIATAAIDSGYTDEARTLVTEARDFSPNDPVSHNIQAEIERRFGDPKQAEAQYQYCMTAFPNDQVAHSGFASVLREKNDLPGAEKILVAAIKKFHDTISLRTNLAAVYRAKGQREKAIQLYKEILAEQPDHIHARMGLAIALKELNRYPEALALVPSMKPQKFEEWICFNVYASIVAQSGAQDEAIKMLQHGIQQCYIPTLRVLFEIGLAIVFIKQDQPESYAKAWGILNKVGLVENRNKRLLSVCKMHALAGMKAASIREEIQAVRTELGSGIAEFIELLSARFDLGLSKKKSKTNKADLQKRLLRNEEDLFFNAVAARVSSDTRSIATSFALPT